MPYTDKNKSRAYRREWYRKNAESEKSRISGIRTGIRTAIPEGIRTGSVQGYVTKDVTSPVSVPKNPVIAALQEKINQIKPVLGTPLKPQTSVPYQPKIKHPNYSESTKYEYAEF